MKNTDPSPGVAGPTLYLLVSTSEPQTVSFNVTTTSTRVTTSHTVTPGSTTRIDLSPDSVYVSQIAQNDRSILVMAEQGKAISVVGVSDVLRSTDAFLALPCDGMAVETFKNYQYAIVSTSYHPSRASGQKMSELLIVTCDPGTRVVITPSQRVTLDSFVPSIQFGGGLRWESGTWTDKDGLFPQEGATLMVSNSNDLTGTIIQSDRPLVVYTGHECAQVPSGVSACDHIVEQVPPQLTWGYTYFLNPLALRESGDYYRVVAVLDDTRVTITCVGEGETEREHTEFTLQEDQGHNWGEFSTHSLPCDSYQPFVRKFCSLQATNPVLVAQFSQGYSTDTSCTHTEFGDPFLSIVPPVVQYLNSYTVTGVNASAGDFPSRFISVSVHQSFFEPHLIMIDGEPLEPDTTAWQPVFCADDLVCGYGIVRPLASGHHRVYHSRKSSALGLQTYGFQHQNSYGLPGGMGLEPLSGKDSSRQFGQ